MPPEAIFVFPGQSEVTCGVFPNAGLTGQISLDQCSFLPALVGDSECMIGELSLGTQTPTTDTIVPSARTAPVTSAPVLGDTCPDVPEGGCSVCGEGACVTNSDAIFGFPDLPDVTCGDLETAGLTSQIPLDLCPFLPNLVFGTCCLPPEPPTPALHPTPAPIIGDPCPEVPTKGRAICGAEDLCIILPDAIYHEYPPLRFSPKRWIER